MSESIKPTPGPWTWDSDPIKGDPLGRVRYRVVTIGKTITQCYYSSDDEHAKDDTRLIADAGTVFHETQCTPRQLVERVEELEEALRDAVDCGMVPKSSAADGGASKYSIQIRVADRIRAALSKALPNADAKEAGK